jgi:hypothetical protein
MHSHFGNDANLLAHQGYHRTESVAIRLSTDPLRGCFGSLKGLPTSTPPPPTSILSACPRTTAKPTIRGWYTVVLLSCVLTSYSSFKGPFWASTSTTLSPAAAAAGIAGINAVLNLIGGGAMSLVGLIQNATGSFATALLPMVVLALAGALAIILMGRRLGRTQGSVSATAT